MMKRLGWWLFSVLSLLLMAATTGLWVRSRFVSDELIWLGRDRARVIVIPQGQVMFMLGWFPPDTPPSARLGFRHERSAPAPARSLAGLTGGGPYVSVAGFGFSHDSPAGSGVSYLMVHVPLWFVLAISLIIPVTQLHLYRSQRRLRSWATQNRCLNCGYDLRASPEQCPECGTPAPATPSRCHLT